MNSFPVKTIKFLSVILMQFFLLLPCMIQGQIPVNIPDKPIVLKGADIHTITNGVISNGMVLIDKGKILKVGTHFDYSDNATVINLEGKHIYPSMIHARNLMGITEIGAVTVTSDFNEIGNINPNVRAEVAFNPASRHLGVAAASGVGIVVTSPTGGLISGLSAAMITDGWTWEQMVLKAPIGLVMSWPAMLGNKNLEKELAELQQAFDKARRYHLARNSDISHPQDIKWEAMQGVFDKSLPVFIHANELSQIQAAITWAEKEKIKMVLTGASDAAYIAHQIAEKNIPVIITPVISGPSRQWEYYGQSYTLPSILYNAGVNFCIAGDFGAAAASRLPQHAAAAVAYGLPADEAIKSITLYPAQILGIENLAGSIEIDKEAHLMITDGDPLEFSTKILQVILKGKMIDMTNKHQQLFEKYSTKPEY